MKGVKVASIGLLNQAQIEPDSVFTPACWSTHRLSRECLVSSWRPVPADMKGVKVVSFGLLNQAQMEPNSISWCLLSGATGACRRAHRLCRECLVSSWRTPAGGLCLLCRSLVTKATHLI